MTPRTISRRVVADRVAWVEAMLAEIQSLPLDDRGAFFADSRNVWTAESCLRRALEALLDLGRHILARAYGVGVSEYKEIATGLAEKDVLAEDSAALLRVLAGYRNRMVYFYHEITQAELYEICATQLGDLEQVLDGYQVWLAEQGDNLDSEL